MPLQATRHVLIHFRGLHMLHNLSVLLTDRLIKLSHVDFDGNQTEVLFRASLGITLFHLLCIS